MIDTVLAIETSCDDTSVAVVRQDGFVLAVKSQNQNQIHQRFGGVVPEMASRGHAEVLTELIDEVLSETESKPDGVVATNRPGLLGSLIVGVVTAKTFAQYWRVPWLAVNHLEGHLFAPFLKTHSYEPGPYDFPLIALAVSGGHTSIYKMNSFENIQFLGGTRDDAAGECLDKFAKILGLGFPGGAAIDALAERGNSGRYAFPRPLLDSETVEFSFSGLKAAGARLVEKMSAEEIEAVKPDLAASFQEAVIDILSQKTLRALELHPSQTVVLTGGVSANSRLRKKMENLARERQLNLLIPPFQFCTDNAAMIGLAGIQRLNRGERSLGTEGASPRLYANDFR